MIAIDLHLKGDYRQMRQVATHFAAQQSGVSNALLAIACNSLGDRECARTALQRMSEFEPIMRDPRAYILRHGATDEIADALTDGISSAQRFVEQSTPAAE